MSAEKERLGVFWWGSGNIAGKGRPDNKKHEWKPFIVKVQESIHALAELERVIEGATMILCLENQWTIADLLFIKCMFS